MSETPDSWILQVRTALGEPAPRRLPSAEGRPAGVLVPLFVQAGELWTLLTRRSEELPTHKGQIAFPGGAAEPGEDPWQAALREAREEVGIVPEAVLRLGQLDELVALSGFQIVPCVGAVPFPLETEINAGEIDEVFTVPLLAFTRVSAIENRTVAFNGRERTLRVYHVAGRQVWGLTARIIANLLDRLGMNGGPMAEG